MKKSLLFAALLAAQSAYSAPTSFNFIGSYSDAAGNPVRMSYDPINYFKADPLRRAVLVLLENDAKGTKDTIYYGIDCALNFYVQLWSVSNNAEGVTSSDWQTLETHPISHDMKSFVDLRNTVCQDYSPIQYIPAKQVVKNDDSGLMASIEPPTKKPAPKKASPPHCFDVTADDISVAYHNNAVSAERIYGNVRLCITAKVKRVENGLFSWESSSLVVVVDTERYSDLRLLYPFEDRAWISTLTPKQEIRATCIIVQTEVNNTPGIACGH